jgi:hypothetical protein
VTLNRKLLKFKNKMNTKSSSLGILHGIINDAIKDGNPKEYAGNVLISAMKLECVPHNLIIFYEILSRAKDDAICLINTENGIHREDYERDVIAIQDLQDFCIKNHPFSNLWESFVMELKKGRYLSIIASLARDFHKRNPRVFLERAFLEKLNSTFSDLLNEILESDVSSELKKYLIDKIEEITRSIRRYVIDGSENLEKTVKSMIFDLTFSESFIKDKDKENAIYKKYKASIITLLLFLRPTPWDIVGAVPDYLQFWQPKIEELIEGRGKVQEIAEKCSDISEIIKEADKQKIFTRKLEQNLISGKDPKLLTGSDKDISQKKIENLGNAEIVSK